MINRNDSRPESLHECAALDMQHVAELEMILDASIRKYESDGDMKTRKLVLPVDRFTIRAVDIVVDMYKKAGWGVRVGSVTSAMFTHAELYVQW